MRLVDLLARSLGYVPVAELKRERQAFARLAVRLAIAEARLTIMEYPTHPEPRDRPPHTRASALDAGA